MKNHCVSADCEHELEMSKERYERDGNYCPKCCAKAGTNAQRKRADQLSTDDYYAELTPMV